MAAHIAGIGQGATLRGVEAMADGWLRLDTGGPVLHLSGGGPLLRLAPLTEKVQWDVRRGCCAEASAHERAAYDLLLAAARDPYRPVEVTGPLRRSGSRELPMLEVRKFRWLADDPPPLLAGLVSRAATAIGLALKARAARRSRQRTGRR